jgi:hypothetical protein
MASGGGRLHGVMDLKNIEKTGDTENFAQRRGQRGKAAI